MKKRIFTTVTLVCCLLICFAAVADMSGKWTGKITTPDGNELQINYVFKVDGGKLTGTAQGDGSPTVIDSGVVKGSDFTFSVSNPEGVVFKHAGKFYPEGDSIGVNIDVNGNKIHATLKRDNK
jgi:hypothetical protein